MGKVADDVNRARDRERNLDPATPPSAPVSAMRAACSELSARTTANRTESTIFCRTFSFIIGMLAAANVTQHSG
jgi:hypothetical protein